MWCLKLVANSGSFDFHVPLNQNCQEALNVLLLKKEALNVFGLWGGVMNSWHTMGLLGSSLTELDPCFDTLQLI